MNLQPRRPPGRADEPFRHLIDEYKHQFQTVTCTCGWHGSSASPDGRTSEWKDHLAATRTSPTSGPVRTVAGPVKAVSGQKTGSAATSTPKGVPATAAKAGG